jgi:hypothetical protein
MRIESPSILVQSSTGLTYSISVQDKSFVRDVRWRLQTEHHVRPGPLLCAADVLQDHLYYHSCAIHRPSSPVHCAGSGVSRYDLPGNTISAPRAVDSHTNQGRVPGNCMFRWVTHLCVFNMRFHTEESVFVYSRNKYC